MKLSIASFLAKYNDSSTGLFKSGQVQGIESDDMREFVTDICDSLPFWLNSDSLDILTLCSDFDFSVDAFPATGGTGASGAILRGNAFRASVAGSPGGVFISYNALVVALIDTPGQTVTNWMIMI